MQIYLYGDEPLLHTRKTAIYDWFIGQPKIFSGIWACDLLIFTEERRIYRRFSAVCIYH